MAITFLLPVMFILRITSVAMAHLYRYRPHHRVPPPLLPGASIAFIGATIGLEETVVTVLEDWVSRKSTYSLNPRWFLVQPHMGLSVWGSMVVMLT